MCGKWRLSSLTIENIESSMNVLTKVNIKMNGMRLNLFIYLFCNILFSSNRLTETKYIFNKKLIPVLLSHSQKQFEDEFTTCTTYLSTVATEHGAPDHRKTRKHKSAVAGSMFTSNVCNYFKKTVL